MLSSLGKTDIYDKNLSGINFEHSQNYSLKCHYCNNLGTCGKWRQFGRESYNYLSISKKLK